MIIILEHSNLMSEFCPTCLPRISCVFSTAQTGDEKKKSSFVTKKKSLEEVLFMRQTPNMVIRNSKAGLTDAQWARIEKIKMNNHPIIHCPMSKGVSEVSERVSE